MKQECKRLYINNLDRIAGMELTPGNNVPRLKATPSIPDMVIPFNFALSSTEFFDSYVHFFIDDYQFERVWRNPQRYIPLFSKYKGILSPDFSLFIDLPLAVQRWNVYRNRILAAYYAKSGIDVIPSAGWGDERSYGFCFEGLPKHSTVAISTNGCLSSREGVYYFEKGFNRMLGALKPETVISYGRAAKVYEGCKTRIVIYDSYSHAMKKRLNTARKG